MEKYGLFTSLNGDRNYSVDFFISYINSFISRGLLGGENSLKVLSNNDMSIFLEAGGTYIDGYLYQNTDNLTINIESSDSVFSRIDMVVIRLDKINREMKCDIVKGDFSYEPMPKSLIRNDDVFEICLAIINIKAGAISITNDDIIDTRTDIDLCGFSKSSIDKIDTETLYNTLEAYLKDYDIEVRGWLKEHITLWLQEFNVFIDSIGSNITNEDILELFNRFKIVEEKINNLNLTDAGIVISSEILTSKNIKDAINEILNKELLIKNDIIETINLKNSIEDIPLSSSWSDIKKTIVNIKEPIGNAATSDVLAGKTFSNSNSINLIGTMPNRGGAQTITPGTSNKVLNSGYYSGNITVAGSSSLIASNIKSGINIFGVNGSLAAGSRYAKGSTSSVKYTTGGYTYEEVTISYNFGFVPSKIIIMEQYGTYAYITSARTGEAYVSPYNHGWERWIYASELATKSRYYIKNTGFKLCVCRATSISNQVRPLIWFAYE